MQHGKSKTTTQQYIIVIVQCDSCRAVIPVIPVSHMKASHSIFIDQLLACAIAFMWTQREHTGKTERVVFVAKKALEAILESKNLNGGSVPQFPQQMRVMHTLNVPMLCPSNLLILHGYITGGYLEQTTVERGEDRQIKTECQLNNGEALMSSTFAFPLLDTMNQRITQDFKYSTQI